MYIVWALSGLGTRVQHGSTAKIRVYDGDKNIINAHMSINLKKCFLYLPNEKCIRTDIFPTVKMLYNITMKQKQDLNLRCVNVCMLKCTHFTNRRNFF